MARVVEPQPPRDQTRRLLVACVRILTHRDAPAPLARRAGKPARGASGAGPRRVAFLL